MIEATNATATGLMMLRHELLAQVAQHGFAEVVGPVARTLAKEWLEENDLLMAMRLGVVGAASDEYVIYRTRDKR